MKTSTLIVTTLVCLHATTFPLYADLDFSSMPIAEVRKIISAATYSGSGHEAADAALKSRRTEVILACFESFEVRSLLSQKVWSMEDCYLKGQMLGIQLRHGRGWEDGSLLQKMNQQAVQAQFFLPMVRQYLPDTPIDYEVISSPERRIALADKLEAAAKKKWGIAEGDPNSGIKQGGLIPAAAESSPPKAAPTTVVPNVITPQTSAAKQPAEQPTNTESNPNANESDSRSYWIGGALTALAVSAIWRLKSAK